MIATPSSPRNANSVSSSNRFMIASLAARCSGRCLRADARDEFFPVDDDALVRAFADEIALVTTGHGEAQRAPFDFAQRDLRRDVHADRRRGDVADVDMRADTLLPRL